MIDPETKRAGIEKAVKWGFVALVAAVTAPAAIWLVEGIISWVVLGFVALMVLQFAPVVASWVANKRIQALVAVIEANPIETMTNLFMDKTQELREAEAHITDFDVSLGNFKNQVSTIKKEYPEEAQTYIDIQSKMQECLDGMREEHALATEELREFQAKIKKAKALFEMAKAANAMLEKSQTAQEEVFAQIKEQVSFDKVRTDLNRAFANMNTAIERRKNTTSFRVTKAEPKQLSAPSTSVIDLGDIRGIKSGITIKRS